MRLGTYIGLVARRVWSKKGVLIGSLLGATLVIALLVVLPLYEASVQAVDLKFTLANAPADDVDVTAFTGTTAYNDVIATDNRELMVTTWQEQIEPWYPSIVERTQSREFVVIPIDGSVDWMGRAAAWREEIEALREAEVEPEEFPPAPFPTPPREATQARMMTAPDIADRVVVVAGEWPGDTEGLPAGGPAAPIPIVLGADLAERTGRGPGDRFILKPFSGLPSTFEPVEVVAVVEPVDASDRFWGIDDPDSMIYVSQATFDAWTGFITVDPTDDPWARSQRGWVDTTATQRWFIVFDPTTLDLAELGQIRGGIANFKAKLAQDAGADAIATSTFLPALLDRFATRSVVIGGPILAILALVVGGALYFLIYTASLSLEREGPEIALLRTRGASTWQTVGIHLAQSAVIAIVAALLAPYVARLLVGITGRIPPLSDLTGGSPLEVAQIRPIEPFLIAGGVITFLAMGLAILPIARRSVLDLRSMAARPMRSSVWQRYNLDLFAIALSLVVLFQLAQRGFVNLTGGEATLDPLAIIFPVLLLFTGALILLRLLPWLLRGVGWLMVQVRSMSFALPGWHLGRNPVPYGRLALLVWLTTGLGAFALTYANTLDQSFSDRAAFAAGADVRVVAEKAGFLDAPDDDISTAVLRTEGAPRQSGSRLAEVLAIRPEEFSEVVAWRGDFGADTPQEVFNPLRPDGVVPDIGIDLPADATALRMDGIVVPRTWLQKETLEAGGGEGDPSLRLMMKVFDAKGQVWTMQADRDFVDSGWTVVEVDLATGLNTDYATPPVPPLTLHTIWLERSDPSGGNLINGEEVLFSDFGVVTPAGQSPLDEALRELTPLNGLVLRSGVSGDVAALAYYSELPPDVAEPTPAEIAASPLNRPGLVSQISLPTARTRVNPAVPSLRRIPDDLYVLLDEEAAVNSGMDVGERSSYSVAGQIFNGTMVGFIGEVPTMSDRTRQGSMIVDFDAINAWINGPASWSYRSNLARVDGPDEIWIATDHPDAAVRRVAGQLPTEPDAVYTILASESEFSSRPVQVGLVAILFVGAIVSVVLALAGVTGYVLLAVSRRAREMGVLRALGFQRSGVATTFAMEQAVVVGLGALIGALGGIALMWTMIGFLQLGETAQLIEPSIVLAVPWDVLLVYIGVVGLMLILSVIWATRRVSARQMSEVLREVER